MGEVWGSRGQAVVVGSKARPLSAFMPSPLAVCSPSLLRPLRSQSPAPADASSVLGTLTAQQDSSVWTKVL